MSSRSLPIPVLLALAPAPAFAELYNVNWVLVASNHPALDLPRYPASVQSEPFFSTPGSPAFTYDLVVETSPDDQFLSGAIDLSSAAFFNPDVLNDFDIGPPPGPATPQTPSHFDTYVSGPAGRSNVSASGTFGSTRTNVEWNYSPPTGSPVLGGRRTIARVTYRDHSAIIPFNQASTIRLASSPTVAVPVPALYYADTVQHLWVRRVSGAWDDGYNWLGSVSPGTVIRAAHPQFTSQYVTQPIDVTLNSTSRYTQSIWFDSSHSVTIAGTGEIRFDSEAPGARSVVAFQGDHTINVGLLPSAPLPLTFRTLAGASLAVTNPLPLPTARIVKSEPGLLRIGALNVGTLELTGGEVELLNGSTAALSRALSVAAAAKLDVSLSGMVIDYSGESVLNALTSDVIAQRIRTESAGRVVGIIEASDFNLSEFMGVSVDGSAVLLRSTLAGDANLSGGVDISDFALLAANFNNPSRWAGGDFDYSGTTGIGDFALLAANFNQSVARQAVPEPAAILAAPMMLMARRRRINSSKS